MNNKKFGIFVVLLVVFSCLMSVDAFAINWRYNLTDALETAKSQQKPIMVDFYTERCGWCKRLDSDTYADSTVKKLAEDFICVKIDGDRERGLVRKYNIRGYPTIFFLNPEGTVVNQVVGYEGPSDFARTMKGVLEKTKKSSAPTKKIIEKIKEIVKSKETAKPAEIAKKTLKQKQTVSMDFAYNGYIKSGDELIAQVNYLGKTYFVKKGDTFEEYKVLEIGTDKLILEGKKGRLELEFKKPIKVR